MNYQFDFTPIWENFNALLAGCLSTLQLSIGAMVFVFVLSIGPAVLLHTRPHSLAAKPFAAFVEVVRNTPFLVQIYFFFFGLPSAGLRLTPTQAALLALVINGTAYSIEIIRGGIASVNKGQIEAGFALGLHPLRIFRHIVLKPALRTVYPALTNQFIFLMLTSSIAASITANELTSVAMHIGSVTFRSFEVFFVVGGLYLVMSVFLSACFGLLFKMVFSYPSR
ncbi:Polar amino acid transport system permease protein OS=Castellaniella defragrans OX=75697 GN=HNR28_001513 PE=3 SV=1 [Castellaniella defragrans]